MTTTAQIRITISHDQSSIDPSATYTNDQFPAVRASLESAYTSALLAKYPEAEVEFDHCSDPYISVHAAGSDEPLNDVRFEVQRICEEVFESGNFWI